MSKSQDVLMAEKNYEIACETEKAAEIAVDAAITAAIGGPDIDTDFVSAETYAVADLAPSVIAAKSAYADAHRMQRDAGRAVADARYAAICAGSN